ncbi:acyl carrier protein [Paenibacillus glufosinatiresistens]|uniref:acyl carrier protein n=1 Tax=Paenibacillus glufosinatiresistens TaxID=3070657 RepID=UPI00286E7529|nr:acyl carrier protein [Paenibacillus sp. YX.27]
MSKEEQLLKLFSEVLEVKENDLKLSTKPEEISEWDSLATVQLIAEIEETFKCKIPFEEIENIKAIEDFLKFI